MKVVSLTVPQEIRQKIEEMAETEDRTVSYISSRLLRKGLELCEPTFAQK